MLPDITSTVPPKAVFLVLQDAIPALHQLSARAALLPSSFKDPSVNLSAMMVSLLLDQFVKAAQLDVKSALRTVFATTVLTDSTATRVTATQSAPEEPSETSQLETGSVLLATLPARPASTTPHSAPVVSMVKDISRPQPSHNLVS